MPFTNVPYRRHFHQLVISFNNQGAFIQQPYLPKEQAVATAAKQRLNGGKCSFGQVTPTDASQQGGVKSHPEKTAKEA